MIYKNVSVNRVIAKVLTDLQVQEGDHRIADMIEWAGEALEKIGAFSQLISKVTGKDGNPYLQLSNYQVALPHDFHKMIQVAYSTEQNGPFYPMRYATGSFDAAVEDTDAATSEYVAADDDLVVLAMDLYDWTYVEAVAALNNDSALKSKLTALLSAQNVSINTAGYSHEDTLDLTYLINDSYIKTNTKDGYISLAYQAIPIDNDGYPLIPDNQSFIDAVYWYITMKILYPKWAAGQTRDAVYHDAKRSWNYYCKQAYGEAMLPNRDQIESIKGTWNRLVPVLSEHVNFNSTLGQKETVYNANIV